MTSSPAPPRMRLRRGPPCRKSVPSPPSMALSAARAVDAVVAAAGAQRVGPEARAGRQPVAPQHVAALARRAAGRGRGRRAGCRCGRCPRRVPPAREFAVFVVPFAGSLAAACSIDVLAAGDLPRGARAWAFEMPPGLRVGVDVDRVLAGAAVDRPHGRAVVDVDGVVALAGAQAVGAGVGVDASSPGPASTASAPVPAWIVSLPVAARDAVGRGAAVDRVGAGAAVQGVVAEPADQRVVAVAAGESVVAGRAVELVGAADAGEDVVARLAVEPVRAGPAGHAVRAAARVDGGARGRPHGQAVGPRGPRARGGLGGGREAERGDDRRGRRSAGACWSSSDRAGAVLRGGRKGWPRCPLDLRQAG